jgi:hypothetical protein
MANEEIIKRYQESVFGQGPTGAEDETFTSVSEQGIPVTGAQDIIQRNQPYATDAPLAPFQALGNVLLPGQPFGKQNRWLMNAEQKKIHEARQLESQAYMKKKDEVRDRLGIIFDKAQKRIEETDDPAKKDEYRKMVLRAKNDILAASGLTEADFAPVSAQTYSLYDEAGLFTTAPNPYPVVEAAGYMGLGTYGSIKGFNKGVNLGLVKKFMQGAGKGFVKGKGGFWGRVGGAIVGGALGVGAADFGYEVALDIMNRAGKAKAYMKMDPKERTGLINSIVNPVLALTPEALTFGDEGINRPSLPERTQNAVDAMVFDAAISTAFFGVRPAYLMVKRFGGALGGLKTKPPASQLYKGEDPLSKELWKDLGAPTPHEILAAEQALAKFDPVDVIKVGKKPGAIWASGERNVPVTEKIQMNIPFIGGAATRLMKSKAFNWLGPASNKSQEWLPPLETISGTTLPRYSVAGRPHIGTYVNAFQRVPAFGGPIRSGVQLAGEAQRIRAINMLGRFAPYITTMEMGVDYLKLSGKAAEGFRAAAVNYDKQLYEAAKSAGAIISDDALVSTTKEILHRASKLTGDSRKAYGPFTNWLRKHILKAEEGWETGTTILNPGRRSIGEFYQLKRKMDNAWASKSWQKSAETGQLGDDIEALYKAFETDIGSLGNTPFKNVTKLWKEYENFLSNGMLLWGTNAGKAMQNVKRYGFNVVIGNNPSRAGQQMFDTLIESTAAGKHSGAHIKENLRALKNIVGDKAYNKGLGHHITKLIDDSISEVEGILYINPDLLNSALGLGKSGGRMQQFFKEALPGPVVTEYKIFNPAKGRWENFYEDLWGPVTQLTKAAERTPGKIFGENVKAIQTQLPKFEDFKNLATVLDRVFKYGMPAQSTFLARSTVLQGPVGAMKSGSPLGAFVAAYGSSAAGFSALGAVGAVAPFFGFRYLGKIVTNPIRMRNWTNAMDDTLPEVLRLRNFERLIQAMPDEYEEWTATMKDMETASRNNNMKQQTKNTMSTAIGNMNKALPNILGKIGQGIDRARDIPYVTAPPWKGGGAPQQDMNLDQIPEAYSSGSELGSSITGSNVMNPGAAASLYTGDTDAALANQYGGMNEGGIVSNPVMGNDGKFTEPQKGINDNPFMKNAKDKGVLGVL